MTPPAPRGGEPPGALRTAWLLAGLAMRRRIHRVGAMRRRKGEGRAAVPRKSARQGLLLLAVLGGLMMLQAFLVSDHLVTGLLWSLEIRDAGLSADAPPAPGPDGTVRVDSRGRPLPPGELPWPSDAGREGTVLVALAATLTLLGFAILFTNLGAASQDLGRVTWSMESLFALPVGARSLFFARVLEYAATDLFAWIAAFPLLHTVFRRAGQGIGWAILTAAVATFAFSLLVSSVRLVTETGLRKRLPLARLKNLQAVFTVVGILFLVGLTLLAFRQPISPGVLSVMEAIPFSATLFPFALPVRAATAPGLLLVLAAGAAAATALATVLAARFVRSGLVRDSGAAAKGRRGIVVPKGEPLFRGILGKEVRLLVRDRNFLVQTLVSPALIVAFQVIVNPALFGSGPGIAGAIVAFGIGAYVLMFGAFSVLAVERESLWLLYTFPRSLDELLRKKTILWVVAAMAYTAIVLAITWRPGLDPGAREILAPVLALIGVGLCGFIAAGIAALGTDPFEDRASRRVGAQWVYLYMFLATSFGFGIWAPEIRVKLVLIVLYALLALALWQKVAERLPLLLDPTRSPPRRISLADGLVYVLAFFLLQVLFQLFYGALELAGGLLVLASYASAGLAVALIAANGLPENGLRAVFSARRRPLRIPAITTGILVGAAAGQIGLLWMKLVEKSPLLEPLRRSLEEGDSRGAVEIGPWFVALAVVAAPLFEEFLFRGILFKGMARSTGAAAAIVGSSLLFAIVHPVAGFPAVFALGLAAAIVYHRTGSLPAAIAAHAVYNGFVLIAAAG